MDGVEYCCLYCGYKGNVVNVGIRVIFSMWLGMYRCNREYVGRGWFVILIICTYGDMLLVVGILETFPGDV
jgi:hypothetical protein